MFGFNQLILCIFARWSRIWKPFFSTLNIQPATWDFLNLRFSPFLSKNDFFCLTAFCQFLSHKNETSIIEIVLTRPLKWISTSYVKINISTDFRRLSRKKSWKNEKFKSQRLCIIRKRLFQFNPLIWGWIVCWQWLTTPFFSIFYRESATLAFWFRFLTFSLIYLIFFSNHWV